MNAMTRNPGAAAMAEGERALAAAEKIAAHLDRHDGDWHWCCDGAIAAVADRLEGIWRDLSQMLPEPRVLRHGHLVPPVLADAIDRHERRPDGGAAEAARVAALMAVPR